MREYLPDPEMPDLFHLEPLNRLRFLNDGSVPFHLMNDAIRWLKSLEYVQFYRQALLSGYFCHVQLDLFHPNALQIWCNLDINRPNQLKLHHILIRSCEGFKYMEAA